MDFQNINEIEPGRNILGQEESPYLLQHGNNPVHWQVWDEQAFIRAQVEDKPIFLSIGYSTCHWCHVMAHESFENEKVAAFLNTHFVNIKVDREERPDVDQVYMAACQMLTGAGGWPLSLFLLPDLKPFYAGTYFPPQALSGRPGFMDLLQSINQVWKHQRGQVNQTAEDLFSRLKEQDAYVSGHLDDHWLDRGTAQFSESVDVKHGGFGGAPKFPRPVVPDFLLRHGGRIEDLRIQKMGLNHLLAMARGGIHDQVGGGFHRYSVDEAWQVPHFEKMLYDQAQLANVYLFAHEQTGDPFFAQVARNTLDYVLRDLKDERGVFYCGEDADSPDLKSPGIQREGAFYLWRLDELKALLTPDDMKLLTLIFALRAQGNVIHDPHLEFSGQNVFCRQHHWRRDCVVQGLAEQDVEERLKGIMGILFEARRQRPRPHRDEKILVSWNGLMISALARAGAVLKDERYSQAAVQAADYFAMKFQKQGALRHWWRSDERDCPAGLADYTSLVQGLLDMFEAGRDQQWLDIALALSRKQDDIFADGRGGLYDYQDRSDLLSRGRTDYDGAEPAPGSVAVMNYLRLGVLCNDQCWVRRAEEVLSTFAQSLNRYPAALPHMLSAMEYRRTFC
ncbi:MAG: thioredoxin domain-containing protein [Desulfobulbaceae bacterium]|uniref:Thioredoxin domain-containing protein n=1 Tax=Candidatus Desulfatifera sulfidica TaxID=2841691 RepID=A0A8J6NA85_9BACT|nr:thioredoxin domain-containing protein [Candidatus Desulfatifera sulfidica]